MERWSRWSKVSSPRAADGADQVDQFAKTGLVEVGPCVVLGQHPLERRVLLLDGIHRLVDQLADLGVLGAGLELAPSGRPAAPRRRSRQRTRRGPRGRRGGSALSASYRSWKASLMYLRKISPSDDVLVLPRVHVPAHLVGGLPELLLKTEIRPRPVLLRTSRLASHQREPPPSMWRPLRRRLGRAKTATHIQAYSIEVVAPNINHSDSSGF